MKRRTVNVFIFRRDFRLHDNTAYNQLVKQDPTTPILHIFIFNPQQINPTLNSYYSKNAAEFMIQSLNDLSIQLQGHLYFFEGKDEEVLDSLLNCFDIQFIAFNCDYTPFAKSRDETLTNWAVTKDIQVITSNVEYTLFPLSKIVTQGNKPYEVFTPFYNQCIANANDISKPTALTSIPKVQIIEPRLLKTLKTPIVKNIDMYYGNAPNSQLMVHGGREHALDIIKRILKKEFKHYDKTRDFPALSKTTMLSGYLKYGCVSIREVFEAVRKTHGVNSGLIRELVWREFYAYVTYHHPKVLQGQIKKNGPNMPFRDKYSKLPWKYDEVLWIAFTEGKTGFPFVDAGIRQLIATGWCHNRARMNIAMCAAKDLHLSPIVVEHWFAKNLLDYDPSSNSGGVQWAYGIGCDSQPYFRTFNYFLQSQRFDKDCEYIKKWIPELKNVANEDIHSWDKNYVKYPKVGYNKPVVDHASRVDAIKKMFARVV